MPIYCVPRTRSLTVLATTHSTNRTALSVSRKSHGDALVNRGISHAESQFEAASCLGKTLKSTGSSQLPRIQFQILLDAAGYLTVDRQLRPGAASCLQVNLRVVRRAAGYLRPDSRSRPRSSWLPRGELTSLVWGSWLPGIGLRESTLMQLAASR